MTVRATSTTCFCSLQVGLTAFALAPKTELKGLDHNKIWVDNHRPQGFLTLALGHVKQGVLQR